MIAQGELKQQKNKEEEESWVISWAQSSEADKTVELKKGSARNDEPKIEEEKAPAKEEAKAEEEQLLIEE